jgi:acyl-CoA synthetase (AMP-forming)/AMP-acid ligase II
MGFGKTEKEVPMLGKTVGDVYDYMCLHYRDKTAIVSGASRMTFNEFHNSGTRLANALLGLGFKRGDRVAVLMPNCPEVLFIDFAYAKSGLVRVPIAYYLQTQDMVFMLRETRASGIIYHEAFREIAKQLKSEYDGLKHVICSSAEESSVPDGERFLPGLIREGSSKALRSEVSEEDLYLIIFTGGTTGVPKGVVHNHRTMVSSLAMELLDFGIGRDEVFLAATPLTHGAGVLVPPVMIRGGSVVILSGFDPTEFLQTIETERVTSAFVVPTMIYALLDHPDREMYDTSSLCNLIYGAAPIAPERIREAIQAFGPVFTQIYGQTEAPMALTVLSREEHVTQGAEHLMARLASCGRPTLATRIRLLDQEGREVAPGEPGEIVAWAPNIMLGYLNRSDLTADTITDGWLHTGDIARQDEYGYLYIVDRAKDMIVSGGFNVFPKEVEDALHEHAAVAVAAVVGVPDEKWGEAVKAVVVLKPGMKASEEELIQMCKQKKGSIMAPKSIDFVEGIPLTPLGKPDKKALRETYWRGHERRVG